jgi:hypothetical protein
MPVWYSQNILLVHGGTQIDRSHCCTTAKVNTIEQHSLLRLMFLSEGSSQCCSVFLSLHIITSHKTKHIHSYRHENLQSHITEFKVHKLSHYPLHISDVHIFLLNNMRWMCVKAIMWIKSCQLTVSNNFLILMILITSTTNSFMLTSFSYKKILWP